MNAFTKFVDSAAGLLIGPRENHKGTRSDAQRLLSKMHTGDARALQEIHERHEDPSWDFYGVIVYHDGEFELRDPRDLWRDSNKMPFDMAASCTLPMPLGDKMLEQY